MTNRMKGLGLACRYSCNCGHAEMYGIADKLRAFGINGSSKESVIQMLSLLDSRDYYEAIAKENGIRDPFNIQVVSYYWKGTPKLTGELWHNFTTLVPIIKLHSRHIRTDMADQCFVHKATVVGENGGKIVVEYLPVIIKDGKLVLKEKPIKKEVESLLAHPSKVGDFVSIHYSAAVEKLEPEDAKTLLGVTYRSLSKFNTIRRSTKF